MLVALLLLSGLVMTSADAKAAANVVAGKAVYNYNCQVCHKDGLMGAPKLGDKAAWAPRIKSGIAVLNKNATTGFKGKIGMMPPKGGNAKLTNAEVENAVAYIVQLSK